VSDSPFPGAVANASSSFGDETIAPLDATQLQQEPSYNSFPNWMPSRVERVVPVTQGEVFLRSLGPEGIEQFARCLREGIRRAKASMVLQ
jgi:hypothetical protein